jgi:elongation factor P
VTEQSFHVSEKVEEADLATKPVKYLYSNKGAWWFCEPNNPRERFELPEEIVGRRGQFLKEDTVVDALIFNEKIIALKMPIKVELGVKDAPPALRGNTAQGGTKQVVLETGVTVNVPLFVNEGDILRINTELGTYVERVDKK